jgi:hypothetical protein
LINIGVSGANSPDAVFAQRNGDVRAVPWSRATRGAGNRRDVSGPACALLFDEVTSRFPRR